VLRSRAFWQRTHPDYWCESIISGDGLSDQRKMLQTIAHITLVVRDYDEAIAFFTETLSFDLIEDIPSKDRQGRHKRWVL
jgi:Glyoxalase/Bleomycin resistance protein/Dioxygenase superfamily